MPTITTLTLPAATVNGPYSASITAIKANMNLRLRRDDDDQTLVPHTSSFDVGLVDTGVGHTVPMLADAVLCDDEVAVTSLLPVFAVNCTVDVDVPLPAEIDPLDLDPFTLVITPLSDGPWSVQMALTTDSDITPVYTFTIQGEAVNAYNERFCGPTAFDTRQTYPEPGALDYADDEWVQWMYLNPDETPTLLSVETDLAFVNGPPAFDEDPVPYAEMGVPYLHTILLVADTGDPPFTGGIPGLPVWASEFLNPDTGAIDISGTPALEDVETVDIGASVTDVRGRSDTFGFSWLIAYPPPVIQLLMPEGGFETVPWTFTLPLELNTGQPLFTSLITGMPVWMSAELDETTGAVDFSGTPGLGDSGLYEITVQITDSLGRSDTHDIVVDVKP